MSTKPKKQVDVDKYWGIFSPLASGGKYLTGTQAATVLKNSQLDARSHLYLHKPES